MYIINNWQDLLPHLQAVWQTIRQALQPEVEDSEFNLTDFGPILLLDGQDELPEVTIRDVPYLS